MHSGTERPIVSGTRSYVDRSTVGDGTQVRKEVPLLSNIADGGTLRPHHTWSPPGLSQGESYQALFFGNRKGQAGPL